MFVLAAAIVGVKISVQAIVASLENDVHIASILKLELVSLTSRDMDSSC